MTQLHILTDSNCHIPPALSHELGITVVPLPFVWDGVTYLDGVDMGPREFYARLRGSESLPTTSGPPPRLFTAEFERLAADGLPILAILVANIFSSTFADAGLAREMVPQADVRLVDSGSNGMALGFQVLAAARAAQAGATIEEVMRVVEQAQRSTGLVFGVRDVNYLRRGGRISAIQGFFAGVLDVVPIMEIGQGPIRPVERVRSARKLNAHLLDRVAERLGPARPLRLGVLHADAEAAAWQLMAAARERFSPDEFLISELNPVLGIHAGPDAVGLAYSYGL